MKRLRLISLLLPATAAFASWTGCNRPQAGGTEAKTFVLSDTMLASTTIETVAAKPVQNELHPDDKGAEMPAIPSSAVIFDKGKNFVIIFRDKFNINAREIKVAGTLDGTSYISHGLRPGERIISRNQLQIYDALNDNNAVRKTGDRQ